MSEVSHRVAEILLSTESIAVYKDKPFVFVSGRISPVYIDCRKLLSFAADREYIVNALAKEAEVNIGVDKFDVVAGGERPHLHGGLAHLLHDQGDGVGSSIRDRQGDALRVVVRPDDDELPGAPGASDRSPTGVSSRSRTTASRICICRSDSGAAKRVMARLPPVETGAST